MFFLMSRWLWQMVGEILSIPFFRLFKDWEKVCCVVVRLQDTGWNGRAIACCWICLDCAYISINGTRDRRSDCQTSPAMTPKSKELPTLPVNYFGTWGVVWMDGGSKLKLERRTSSCTPCWLLHFRGQCSHHCDMIQSECKMSLFANWTGIGLKIAKKIAKHLETFCKICHRICKWSFLFNININSERKSSDKSERMVFQRLDMILVE